MIGNSWRMCIAPPEGRSVKQEAQMACSRSAASQLRRERTIPLLVTGGLDVIAVGRIFREPTRIAGFATMCGRFTGIEPDRLEASIVVGASLSLAIMRGRGRLSEMISRT
jgi:hypothetical protein